MGSASEPIAVPASRTDLPSGNEGDSAAGGVNPGNPSSVRRRSSMPIFAVITTYKVVILVLLSAAVTSLAWLLAYYFKFKRKKNLKKPY